MVMIIVLNFTSGVLSHPRLSAFSLQRPGQAGKGESTLSLYHPLAQKDLSGPPRITVRLLLLFLYQGNSESQERQKVTTHSESPYNPPPTH